MLGRQRSPAPPPLARPASPAHRRSPGLAAPPPPRSAEPATSGTANCRLRVRTADLGRGPRGLGCELPTSGGAVGAGWGANCRPRGRGGCGSGGTAGFGWARPAGGGHRLDAAGGGACGAVV